MIHLITDSDNSTVNTENSNNNTINTDTNEDVDHTDILVFDDISMKRAKLDIQQQIVKSSVELKYIQDVLIYASKVPGNNNISIPLLRQGNGLAPPEPMIPQPRWFDPILILRMCVSLVLFFGQLPRDKFMYISAGCALYYIYDTGIFKYIYKHMVRYYKRKYRVIPGAVAGGGIGAGVEQGAGAGQGAGQGAGGPDAASPPPIPPGIQAPPPPLTLPQYIGAMWRDLQGWVLGGLYIPPYVPPPGHLSTLYRILLWVYERLVDMLMIAMAFLLSLLPNWTVLGFDIF